MDSSFEERIYSNCTSDSESHDFLNEGHCVCRRCCTELEELYSELQCSELQKYLYRQCLDQSSFCDVTLHIGNKVLKAHSCVLVVCDYFSTSFNYFKNVSKFRLDEPEKSYDIVLNCDDDGEAETMERVIKFIYTDHVTLTMDNVQQYLALADYLQFPRLTHQCTGFLENTKVTQKNCVQIMLLFSQYKLDQNLYTYKESLRFVRGLLPEFMRGDKLLILEKVSVLAFMTDPTLSYVSQEDFFNFIVRWTESNEEHRKQHFPELFLVLDLCLVSWEFLTGTIGGHPLVDQFPECRHHYSKAYNEGLAIKDGCRRDFSVEVIIVGGGYEENLSGLSYSKKIMAYMMRDNRWARLPDMPCKLQRPLMAFTSEGQLLVVDGFSHRNQMDALQYSPQQNKWNTVQVRYSDLETIYDRHALVLCEGQLFLVATSKSSQPHDVTLENEISFLRPHYVKLYKVVWNRTDTQDGSDSISLGYEHTFFQCPCDTSIQVACLPGHGMNSDLICVGMSASWFTSMRMYDVRSQCLADVPTPFINMNAEPLALGLPQGFLSVYPGKNEAEMILRDGKTIIRGPDFTVPLPPSNELGTRFSSTCVGSDLYVFGGEVWNSCSKFAARFSFSERKWVMLEKMPCGLARAGVAWGAVPFNMLRCHAECPHCTLPGDTGGTKGQGEWRI